MLVASSSWPALIAFPVLILIVATAATFGPWFGFVYALLGVLASALVMYFVGALLGRKRCCRSLSAGAGAGSGSEIDDRGILAVAAIRLVPVAPFTLVNLTAGALSIGLLDYVVGTLIGMLPGLIAISAFGYQITRLVTDVFGSEYCAAAARLRVVWIALRSSAQSLLNRARRRTHDARLRRRSSAS